MRSRLWLPGVAVLALMLGFEAWVAAQHQHGSQQGQHAARVTTVRGEVVDLSCYLDHNARGRKHRKCAVACAKKGLPMGILAADGKLYLLIEDHGRADAYKRAVARAADTITVKGQVIEKGGIRAIKVLSVSE